MESTIAMIAVAVISALVTGAIAWGATRSEIVAVKLAYEQHREELAELKRDIGRDLVGKEHCREVHARSTKDYDELKVDLKAINSKLDTLLMRSQA